MEKFFQFFKEKLSLGEDHIKLLKNVILNDNTSLIKQNFNIFYENKANELKNMNFFYCSLFLYCLDIHREFKKKLLSVISSKFTSYQETNKYITNFLGLLDLDLIDKDDINELKYKILLLNNLYDVAMKYFDINKKEKNNENDKDKEKVKIILLNKFFKHFINILEKKELSFLLKNSNDEIGMILTFYINCLLNIINYLYNDALNYDFTKILNIIENDLINIQLDYTIKTKDLLFIYSNFYFNIYLKCNKNDENLLKSKAEFLFSECLLTKNFEIIFSYMKGLYNNYDYSKNINCFSSDKLNILNKFIEKKVMLNIGEIEFKFDLSLSDFYLYFLDHNINGKYSLIINDIIVLLFVKIFNLKKENIRNDLITWIQQKKLIDLLLIKMKNEKNNFNFIEDNFFDILSLIYNKTNTELKLYISQKGNQYLKDILNTKKRPLTNECTLFQFLKNDIKNGQNEPKKTLIDFMILILSFPYDKKDITLIMENTKNFFEFYREEKYYNEFYQTFPEYFIEYLQKIPVQYLQNLNTLYLQLNKLNPHLYFLIVKYCFNFINQKISNKKNISNQDKFISIYAIFFALLRPIRLQKKSLLIKDNEIIIFNNKLKEEIKIDIGFISYLVLSSNEYLTLSILEFVNELDDKNKTFKIIMKIIKYGVKNQNQEYKGGLSKSLRIYFSQYILLLNKLILKLEKNKSPNNDDSINDKNYINLALNKNIIKLCSFLSDNIYDRPVENLLTYLELLKLIIYLIDEHLYELIDINDLLNSFKSNYEKIIFEKGIFLSLISLLKHSWSYVRINAYEILSNKNYSKLIVDNKTQIIRELKNYSFSLRQMDIEGSSCLFVLLLQHYNNENLINDEIIRDIFKQIFDYDINNINFNDKNSFCCENQMNKIMEILLFFIQERKKDYINLIKDNSNIFDIKKYSIHSFLIFIRNIIDLQKSILLKKTKYLIETLNLFFRLTKFIISLNTEFLEFLINNGVSEFTLEEQNEINEDINENTTNVNHENKLLISLWNSSKYSLNILNSILDIFSSNYQNLSSSLNINSEKNFKNIFLFPLKNNFESIIPIIINAKHMGVVRGMSESLFKISIILNKSEMNSICKEEIETFVEKELSNHVVSSILRRSAGIPFLITTLIRSYITENYSYNFIKNILKSTISSLLDNFKKYQDNKIDASVHCLNILRVICDDTIIKPYIKEFYDEIIMDIINGLQSKNWSIKNACMLMFSRIITNNFLLQNETEMQRTLLTFKEYFYDKNDFYNVIVDILKKNNDDSKLNDCLLLFVTFFTKMRHTKPNEYKNERLLEIIKLLFLLDKKDNKLFRKLLSSAMFKLYGDNYKKFVEDIIINLNGIISKYKGNNIDIYQDNKYFLEINNQIDFYYNIINEIIKSNNKEIKNEDKLELIILFKKLILLLLKKDEENNNTYFGLSKFIQLIKKLPNISELITNTTQSKFKLLSDLYFNYEIIGVNIIRKNINLDKLFSALEKNSRIFNFFKLIKHALSLFVDKLHYSFEKIDIIQYFKNKKLEEILVIIFKRYSDHISFEFISKLFQNNELDNLFNYSVNISSHLVLYLEKIINNKTSNISKENIKLLLNKIVDILKKEKGKTKLITKLFSLLPYLLIYNDNNKNEYKNDLNSIMKIIYDYIQSDNLDKLRISGLLCLDKIIKNISRINNNNINIFQFNEDIQLQTLKILFLLLNDEYSNIRKKASEIFVSFNNLAKIINFKNKNIIFINDYICQKILTKLNINKEINKQFCEFILDNNFYFRVNIFETKIFYIEPDNNYIDNSQNKMLILSNILKNKFNIEIKTLKEEYKFDDKIMIVFEEFTEKIKIIINNTIKEKKESKYKYEDKEDFKFIFKNIIRPKIYLLTK